MRLLLCPLVGAVVLAGAALAVDITQWGQVVPDGDTGVLRNDLLCPGVGGFCLTCTKLGKGGRCTLGLDQPCTDAGDCAAFGEVVLGCVEAGVALGRGARLDLGGFAVRGDPADRPEIGVLCTGRCAVEGPGEVANFARTGIGLRSQAYASVRVSDLSVHDVGTPDVEGIGASGQRVIARNVDASHNAYHGLSAYFVRAANVTTNDNGQVGMTAAVVRAIDVVANGNGFGGLFGGRSLYARGLTAVGNGGPGVLSGGTVTLIDSTVAGSGGLQVDVASAVRPRISGTSCGLSAQVDQNGFGLPWGVCADD